MNPKSKADETTDNLKNEPVGTESEVDNVQENEPTLEKETALGNETEETEEKVEEISVEAQIQIEKDKYMRLYSEFDNYKRRTAKERLEYFAMSNKDMMLTILPFIDDFQRAMSASMQLSEETKKELEGMQLIVNKLYSNLNAKGLKEMECLNMPFDVDMHEAITKIPAGEEKSGIVVDVIEKGYLLKESVLRYAKVVVGE